MISFRLKRTLKLGIKSLWMHRLRSTLTALGIIFGVSSVIAMLAIGEGASQKAQAEIASLGSQNIIIKTVKPPEDEKASGQSEGVSMLEYGLTYTDAEIFRNSIPNVQVIVPNRIMPSEVWYRNRKLAADVIGTVPWYPETFPIQIQHGRFISSIDTSYRQGVCVVDEKVAEDLFLFDYPIRQYVKIGQDYYKVVGVVSEQTRSSFESNPAEAAAAGKTQTGTSVGKIYIPLTTAKGRFGEIQVQVGTGGANAERVELQEIILKVGSLEEVMPTRDIVEVVLGQSHKKEDYQITVPLELMRRAKALARIFSIVLGSIAAISLLVGGIGIMNIMMATVSERTREIGIRRALGAKKRDIIIQFLSETLLLTLAGGLLGIALGSAIPFFVTKFGNQPTVITASSLILAFGISAIIGITFGLYPAYRAANMDPIESLRHE
jgi:putative ABC transport system permease protein